VHQDIEFKMAHALTAMINLKIAWVAQTKIVLNAIKDIFCKMMDLARLVIKHLIIVTNAKIINNVSNATQISLN
jgi:hypothetical protein